MGLLDRYLKNAKENLSTIKQATNVFVGGGNPATPANTVSGASVEPQPAPVAEPGHLLFTITAAEVAPSPEPVPVPEPTPVPVPEPTPVPAPTPTPTPTRDKKKKKFPWPR